MAGLGDESGTAFLAHAHACLHACTDMHVDAVMHAQSPMQARV